MAPRVRLWSAYNMAASLPYWPINPSISSDIWFNFELDFARALWALLPPTLLWGASFPLALSAAASKEHARPSGTQEDAKAPDGARLFAGIYAANTLGAIIGALGASLLLVAWMGSQRAEQLLIALSIISGLLLVVPARLRGSATASSVLAALLAVVSGGLLIRSVPPLAKLLVAHGRYAATWAGQSDVIYAAEGVNSSGIPYMHVRRSVLRGAEYPTCAHAAGPA
jgi:spermidine synthase